MQQVVGVRDARDRCKEFRSIAYQRPQPRALPATQDECRACSGAVTHEEGTMSDRVDWRTCVSRPQHQASKSPPKTRDIFCCLLPQGFELLEPLVGGSKLVLLQFPAGETVQGFAPSLAFAGLAWTAYLDMLATGATGRQLSADQAVDSQVDRACLSKYSWLPAPEATWRGAS